MWLRLIVPVFGLAPPHAAWWFDQLRLGIAALSFLELLMLLTGARILP